MKKNLGNELQFIRQKTVVYSAENSSSFGGKLEFELEEYSNCTAAFFELFRTLVEQKRVFVEFLVKNGAKWSDVI